MQIAMKPETKPVLPQRAGAIGKALIVWLASGSFLAAVVAFFAFSAMGCQGDRIFTGL